VKPCFTQRVNAAVKRLSLFENARPWRHRHGPGQLPSRPGSNQSGRQCLQSLALSINEEIRSRITYSVILPRLAPDTLEAFLLTQLDRAGLGHNTFTQEALALVIRSSEGILRRLRNLAVSSLIEAVRDLTRVVDLKQVNRVLIQPHWRKDCDQPLP